jgi:hypothetical protein
VQLCRTFRASSCSSLSNSNLVKPISFRTSARIRRMVRASDWASHFFHSRRFRHVVLYRSQANLLFSISRSRWVVCARSLNAADARARAWSELLQLQRVIAEAQMKGLIALRTSRQGLNRADARIGPGGIGVSVTSTLIGLVEIPEAGSVAMRNTRPTHGFAFHLNSRPIRPGFRAPGDVVRLSAHLTAAPAGTSFAGKVEVSRKRARNIFTRPGQRARGITGGRRDRGPDRWFDWWHDISGQYASPDQ